MEAITGGWQRPSGERADGKPADPDYRPMDPTLTAEEARPRTGDVRAQTAAARARRLDRAQELRDELALGLLDDACRLRDQLFRPITYTKPMTRSLGSEGGEGGANLGQEIEIVRYTEDQPTFRDQQAIATSVAIVIDKAMLLLGEVTERTETLVRDPALRRARIAEVRDELAARREAAREATGG
jgi:hypothetical protein